MRCVNIINNKHDYDSDQYMYQAYANKNISSIDYWKRDEYLLKCVDTNSKFRAQT